MNMFLIFIICGIYITGSDGGYYFGCFKDTKSDRDLKGTHTDLSDNSPEACIYYCVGLDFKFAGVQYSKQCWCGDHYGKHGKLSENKCNYQCPGSKTQTCGGFYAMQVYSTGCAASRFSRTYSCLKNTRMISENAELLMDTTRIRCGIQCKRAKSCFSFNFNSKRCELITNPMFTNIMEIQPGWSFCRADIC